MPELPEVENIAMGLRDILTGHTLRRVEVLSPVILKGPEQSHWRRFAQGMSGQGVKTVTRRAKRLQLVMDSDQALVIQLGMTGKFLRGLEGQRPPHTHIVFALDHGSHLYYVDPRRFGRVWLFGQWQIERGDVLMEEAGMGHLGPDAITMRQGEFNRILKTERPIKALLLDQTRIAGLGNIYVDESLFATGIRPTRPARDCLDQSSILLKHIKSVLRRAIRAGGTTFSDYRNAYGDMGRFHHRLQVYQRHGQPCKRCGQPLERWVVAGRGSHVCPQCQV